MTDRRRPSQRRSDELVSSVISATAAVVGQFGMDRTTIDKIAGKAGVSVGSIYQYFSSKESILGSFVTGSLTANRDMMLERFEEWRELPLADMIPKVIYHMADHWQNTSATARHVFAYAGILGVRGIQMRLRREVISGLAEVFEYHRDELRDQDFEKAATVVIHAGAAIVTAEFMDSELPYSIDELKEEAVKMATRYLLKP